MPAQADPHAISVLLTPNGRYAQHAAACMASLLRQSEARFDFVIASSENPAGFADRIRRSFAGNSRVSIEFRHFQVPADTHFPIVNNLSLDAYLRFWVHELLPGRSRAIYLDPDIIAIGPVDELWNTDLQGKVLGAVPIPNSIRVQQHGMPPGSKFFNSGVLLLDLEAWAARHYRDRCLEYLRQYPERALDADQDILNLVLIGDWLALDYKWNLINPFYRQSQALDLGMPQREVAAILADARMVHFNGSHKPWFYLDNHPRQRDYFRSLAETDWRDWRPADRTPINMVRKRLSRVLPPWMKNAGKVLLKRPS